MTKLKRYIFTFFASIGLLAGFVVVAPVAMAQPAEALSISKCQEVRVSSNLGSRKTTCYFDYTWWEFVTTGKRDGYYTQYCYSDYSYCSPWRYGW